MPRPKEFVDLKLVVFHTTHSGSAFLVGLTEDENASIWLPSSQAKKGDQCGIVNGHPIHEFQVSEWLAIEKELV